MTTFWRTSSGRRAPERLLVESDAPMVGERRTSNHPWAVSTILARVASVKAIDRLDRFKFLTAQSTLKL